MRIGTTPTHQFTLPFEVDRISAIEITYAQRGQVILTVTEEDCTMQGQTVQVTLGQEDTFAFAQDINVDIQLRVKDINGTVFASDILTVSCQRCLSDEVI